MFDLHRISFLLFAIFLAGCSIAPNQLKNIEAILDSKPDSALIVLQKMNSNQFRLESDKALYGLLLFRALDKNYKPVGPDSLIDFSMNYYLKKNQKPELGISYYYKARIFKKAQRFDKATELYLKALDIFENSEEYYFLGKIYSDMGDMCSIQKDDKESLNKFKIALSHFQNANNSIEVCYKLIDIGRIYKFLNDPEKALLYFRKAINQSSDSLVHGSSYQEIGIFYYAKGKLDSAKYYLNKSLQYPFVGTSYAIRCNVLADLYYSEQHYDSAIHLATLAFNYPTTFYNQRDCNRILANSEYNLGNYDKVSNYLHKYQDCADSIIKIENQTKTTVLENLHNTTDEATGAKRNLLLIVSVFIVITLLIAFIAFYFYERNKFKKGQLGIFKEQLVHKQEFASQKLAAKIDEVRALQSQERKNASPDERIRLDRELYEKCLHISNWDTFSCEMNHAFNNIVEVLETDYPDIIRKEIIWICFHLLNIPNSDRNMLLNTTSEGLYKLKQRLAKKLHLKTTKELDLFLIEMIKLKN